MTLVDVALCVVGRDDVSRCSTVCSRADDVSHCSSVCSRVG